MLYFIYGIVCIVIVVAQSTAYPVFLSLNGLYDVFLPFLVYLAVFRPVGEPIVAGIFAGVMMDSLSGGAFGLYTLSYLWITICIRFAIRFFDGDSILFQLSAVGLGELLENGLFWATEEIAGKIGQEGFGVTPVLTRQLLPAILTGPLLVMFFKWLFQKLEASHGEVV
ncbi:MAG: rod shape-determining protein MreD [Deltaproteobacteria bacterium]|nr:MAG: rod shape-determining protein MreD [Deltaproteobacteria bacterium]